MRRRGRPCCTSFWMIRESSSSAVKELQIPGGQTSELGVKSTRFCHGSRGSAVMTSRCPASPMPTGRMWRNPQDHCPGRASGAAACSPKWGAKRMARRARATRTARPGLPRRCRESSPQSAARSTRRPRSPSRRFGWSSGSLLRQPPSRRRCHPDSAICSRRRRDLWR